MKGLIIGTDSLMSIGDFSDPYYQGIEQVVGGYMEIVHPKYLPAPYCMIVNEEGLRQELPPNPYGCILYNFINHGHPIVGDIVLLKEGIVHGEPDLIGLDDKDICLLGAMATAITGGIVKWKGVEKQC